MRSFAKSARYMCSPGGDVGKEPRRVFVIQLSEAVQEWRRRHSTSLRQVVTYRNSDTMDHGALMVPPWISDKKEDLLWNASLIQGNNMRPYERCSSA